MTNEEFQKMVTAAQNKETEELLKKQKDEEARIALEVTSLNELAAWAKKEMEGKKICNIHPINIVNNLSTSQLSFFIKIEAYKRFGGEKKEFNIYVCFVSVRAPVPYKQNCVKYTIETTTSGYHYRSNFEHTNIARLKHEILTCLANITLTHLHKKIEDDLIREDYVYNTGL